MRELWQTFGAQEWAALARPALHIVVIVVLAWGLQRLAGRLIGLAREHLTRRLDDPEQARRVATLVRVLRYVATVVITLVAGMLVLHEVGLSIAPLLAAAGVAGIAIGFGAQSLVKDYFTGVIMLLEDQARVGDVIEAGGKAGLVEAVTLRYIRLRDYDGNVHYVPNGTISTVTNRSRGFAYAVVEIGIAYRENVDEAFEVMREVGRALRADAELGPKILDDLEIAGVDSWADSAVTLRCRMKTLALQQWAVRRAFLKRLKEAFDERGIEIPFPHLTVYAGQPKQGPAPPFQLRGDWPASRSAGH
ncbi:MAG: mechanosensitive ion channel family protein [Rubrivivax sp.]|nr:mechanosensitive ion channel family protein [Rubrivivax sp.]